MATPEQHFIRKKPASGGEPGDGACHAEASTLVAIAQTLFDLSPPLATRFKDWSDELEALLSGPVADSLDIEAQLETLAMDLRLRWLKLATSIVINEMRSPAKDHLPLMPVSKSGHFVYERVVSPTQAEEKLSGQVKVAGWQCESSLFANGLAAISAAIAVLRLLKDRYQRADLRPLHLDMFGGYFETLRLMSLLDTPDLRCQTFQDLDAVLERFSNGESDILFLEMIAYDWVQTVVDPNRLIEAANRRPSQSPWLLLLDTTLLGPTFDINPLLLALGDRRPDVVLDIRSGLKLDQVGLEFSNVGIIRVFTPDDPNSQKPAASDIHRELMNARKVMGNGLTYAQIAALDAPWIFNPEWMRRHAEAVFRNNRQVALALRDIGGIFSTVHHPSLGYLCHLTWAESGFIVIEFHQAEDTEPNRELLLAVIEHEIRTRKLVMYIGASFGFRHHRCEILVPEGPYRYEDGAHRGYLKLAIGARSGPSKQGIVDLINDLSKHQNFKALRSAYPDLKLGPDSIRFPDLHSLRERS